MHAFEGYESELDALHVRTEHHRRGVGRALSVVPAAAMAERGQQGTMLCVLAANPACRFYERLGATFLADGTEQIDEATAVPRKAYGWRELSAIAAESRMAVFE